MIIRFIARIYEHLRHSPLLKPFRTLFDYFRQRILGKVVGFPYFRHKLNVIRLKIQYLGLDLSTDLSARSPTYIADSVRDMENYFRQFSAKYGPLSNPFSYYQLIIDNLLQMDRLRLVPLYELQSVWPDGVRTIGLRHDIDSNPGVALRAARYLVRKGVCGSFYLLHTAPYYGNFHNGAFIRNPMMAELVLRFIVAGCELGLHNDAFWVYTIHNADGAESVRQELAWLRSLGVVVHGTVAHNSAPVYGGENYEIFEERVLWYRQVRSPSGKILPLGKLSERKLKLSYEGNFAIRKKDIKVEDAVEFCSNVTGADVRSKAWMRRYLIDNPCCDRAIDYQFWLIGKNKWVAAGKQKGKYLFEWEIDVDRLLDLIQNLPENTRSVLVIHPDYFGP